MLNLVIRLLILFFVLVPKQLSAADGSGLWLPKREVLANEAEGRRIVAFGKDASVVLAKKELGKYWRFQSVDLRLDRKLAELKDGYQLDGNAEKIQIKAYNPIGLLYGAYHLLRLQETGADLSSLYLREVPDYDLRMLNHWDNLDGTVERGYAGYSLWRWDELPSEISPRYEAYARANASIGINAVVLNNVNASPQILQNDYIGKVKALADIFRPYGIKVFLSVNFASPRVLGGLPDADPLRIEVQQWWKQKVKEIYTAIPDFGGFLVKANSEGQPGPQDYGRSHADGANMLADVLQPYGGTLFWRAFVYSPSQEDRAKQAYLEFVPLDGKFRDNVIIQIKNGPIDFQPREPFNPLFGAMKHTAQMLEFQLTQEYLGFSNHLVYLAPLFKETLDSDTYAYGAGSSIARITQGVWFRGRRSAIAGVANIGSDANWTGHPFAQANWYAFGRMAWDSNLTSDQIAEEWLRSTFSRDTRFVEPVKAMMLASREAAVNYMMPLGLHHIFAFDHHYGPEPWGDRPGSRPDWMPWYYHNADSIGLGFDRTATGSNAVAQYFPPLDAQYGSLSDCPENLLLWFHHVSWDYRMKSGNSLWNELCWHYADGVTQARQFQQVWDSVRAYVDAERFAEVQAKLRIQARDAVWWRDACLLYFQTFSKRPFPKGMELPMHELEELKQIKLDLKHHN